MVPIHALQWYRFADTVNLSYESKVALTHVEYPDITCGFYVKGYENCNELGNIMDFKGFWGQKVYDQFDWVKFLNQK